MYSHRQSSIPFVRHEISNPVDPRQSNKMDETHFAAQSSKVLESPHGHLRNSPRPKSHARQQSHKLQFLPAPQASRSLTPPPADESQFSSVCSQIFSP